MTNDRIFPESGNPPQTLPEGRALVERYQKRPLKQLSDRSEMPAAVSA